MQAGGAVGACGRGANGGVVSVAGRAHVSGVSSSRTFTASIRSSPRSLRKAVSGVVSCRTGLADEPETGDVLALCPCGVGPRPARRMTANGSRQAPGRAVGLGPADRRLTVGGAGERSDKRGSQVAVELTGHLVNIHPRGRQHAQRSPSSTNPYRHYAARNHRHNDGMRAHLHADVSWPSTIGRHRSKPTRH